MRLPTPISHGRSRGCGGWSSGPRAAIAPGAVGGNLVLVVGDESDVEHGGLATAVPGPGARNLCGPARYCNGPSAL
jgi:hypothetical protein